MTRFGRLGLAAAGVWILAALPGPLWGQARPAVAVDVAVDSRYVWRGITRRDGWVLQPDALAGAQWAWGSVSAGAWADIELSRAEPASEELGLGKALGEWNVWAQLERRFSLLDAPLDLAVGYVRYFVDRSAAAAVGTTAFNTGELYLDGRWRLRDLEPRATLWYDIEEVKGAYAELGAAYRVPVFPLAVPSLYLRMVYGFSWGQAAGPDEGGYFGEDGLTHIVFSVEAPVFSPLSIGPLGSLYATPSLHFQVNLDDATRRQGRAPADLDRGNVWWGGLVLSWFW